VGKDKPFYSYFQIFLENLNLSRMPQVPGENQNTKYEKKKARKLGGIFGTFGNNPYLCPRKQ
jgi:hypothetical protein